MKLTKSALFAIVWVCVAAACGKSLNGTYHDQSGQVTLELKSGGSAHITMMGEGHDLTYKVEGSKITLHAVEDSNATGGDLEITRNNDGTLSMAMFTLTKK